MLLLNVKYIHFTVEFDGEKHQIFTCEKMELINFLLLD